MDEICGSEFEKGLADLEMVVAAPTAEQIATTAAHGRKRNYGI
jgi:hypothetical protein